MRLRFKPGIVDGVYLTLCPKGAGSREIPAAVEGHRFVLAALANLELLKCKVIESEVFYTIRCSPINQQILLCARFDF